MKNISNWEVFSIKNIEIENIHLLKLMIFRNEWTLTLCPISISGSKIVDTLTVNDDKELRRPSSKVRQSTKVATLIFNFVKVEDT